MKEEQYRRMNTVFVSITFVVAIVSLAVALVAYEQSGMGVDEKIAVTLEEDRAQINQELAVIDAKMTLLSLRAEMIAGNISSAAADEVADTRKNLAIAYDDTTGDVKESWLEMDNSLDELEVRLREGSVDIVTSLNNALLSLNQQLSLSPQELCVRDGGEWKEFPTACADSCDAGDVCAQVLTESCDCGSTACWNGLNCEVTS